MVPIDLSTALIAVAGIGKRRSQILAETGLETVEDLLWRLPFRYEDRSKMISIEGLQEQVRERFRACLENKEGSLHELTEVLERNARFLIDLNRSYQASLYEGNQSMLTRLDPRPILEGHKRVLGSDFEGAWKTISRAQADLVNLSRAEMWEQFFVGPFRDKLAGYQD